MQSKIQEEQSAEQEREHMAALAQLRSELEEAKLQARRHKRCAKDAQEDAARNNRNLRAATLRALELTKELNTKVSKEALVTLRNTYQATVVQMGLAESDNRLMVAEIGRLRGELNETRLKAMRHGVNLFGGGGSVGGGGGGGGENVSMLSTSLLMQRSFTGQ